MDNEKKYCKYASELTVEELEGKIGPLTGKYEMRLFEIIKECIKCSPIPLVDAVRHGYYWLVGSSNLTKELRSFRECIWARKTMHFRSRSFVSAVMKGFDEYRDTFGISFSFDGIDNEHALALINLNGFEPEIEEKYDSNMIDSLIHESWILIEEIIVALIDLKYVRLEFRDYPEDFPRLHFLWYMCGREESYDPNCSDIDSLRRMGWEYETCEVKHYNRINRLMEHLKEKLPPLQYELFKYNVMSGVLRIDWDPEKKVDQRRLLPYSEFEYKILCTANYNYRYRLDKEKLFEILRP